MNLIKAFLCFVFSFTVPLAWAQVKDSLHKDSTVHQLSTVEILAPRQYSFSSGNKTETLDSSVLARYSNSNLADLLANESQVFIKSYGLGSVATSSFRGAGASHTAVLWNGFNIQSPMLAQLDISLIPVNFLNNVKLQYGSAGALWGTGAVGGTIHLNNKTDFDTGIKASANIGFGSFGDKQQQLSAGISKKRWASELKLFNHTAKNDFPFINTAQYGKPEQKQNNAELAQHGLLQENYFLINKRQKLNTRFWYQYSDRNVPPTMTQNISIANQQDRLYRITTEWQRTGERMELLARAAYFDEYIYFNDSTISEHSKSRSKAIITEAEGHFRILKTDMLNIGINNTYNEAITRDYANTQTQNRISLFVNYKLYNKRNTWNVVASARQEFVQSKAVPFVASLGFEGKLLNYFILKSNAAKHYRLPSFNDLYWVGQGAKGNALLQPESGWTEEVSLVHKHSFKNLLWEAGATAFNRTIDNWIMWIPNQLNIWSPENVVQVWSRGLEYKLSTAYTKGRFKTQVTGMYNYILSTNEKLTTSNTTTLNKQLIYVPIQNAQGSISLSYRTTTITYTQVYTGYRYTTSDNKKYLKPYSIGNVTIAQLVTLNKTQLKLYVQLNNVWQETYQVIEYRAMPLFNYQFGLAIYFSDKNKTINNP